MSKGLTAESLFVQVVCLFVSPKLWVTGYSSHLDLVTDSDTADCCDRQSAAFLLWMVLDSTASRDDWQSILITMCLFFRTGADCRLLWLPKAPPDKLRGSNFSGHTNALLGSKPNKVIKNLNASPINNRNNYRAAVHLIIVVSSLIQMHL